ncbi:MAG: TonB-dependent receptor [Flavobacterium sp.]|nr:MAG: TonB-dependent receptor [Flavobacterium sp.]
MRRPQWFLLFLFFISLSVNSQNTISLTGKIIEHKTNLPIEAATVYLTSVKDSAVIDYTISDKNGNFTINTKKLTQPVILKVSYLGFKTYLQQEKELLADRNFGILFLEENDNTLGEVIITGEAPPVRIKNDTLEFNASSFKLRPDANVEALLKQLPGVEIDADGKITVNGKEVNQILVNGKPFFDKDGKIAIQNLPSDIINKVQVSDSKTKKEELSGQKASSNAASINLTIDEEKNKGFFGKIMGGYGSDSRYESSLLANYFKNKRKISVLASSNNINATGFSMNEIFDNMGGGRNNSIWMNDNGSFSINGMRFGGGSGITQSDMVGINYADEFFKGFDFNSSYFFTDADSKNKNRMHQVTLLNDGNFTTDSDQSTNIYKMANNFNADIEYKIDSTATLYINPKFVTSRVRSGFKGQESSTNEAGQLLNDNVSDSYEENETTTFSNSLYFNKNLKRKGRSYNIYFSNDNSKETVYNRAKSESNFYGDPDNDGQSSVIETVSRNQERFRRNLKDNYNGGIEYIEPLRDSLSIRFGIEMRNNNLVNDKITYDFSPENDNYSSINPEQTSFLSSATQTLMPTVGLTFAKSKYNLYMNFGTSITNFKTQSLYLGNSVSILKNYMLPDASAYLSYKFSKSQNLWLNYNFSTTFATPDQIMPVEDLSDPLHTFFGNPNLDPGKSHDLYLSFSDYDYATKSGYSLYAGGNFREVQIASSTTYDESRKATTQYENVYGTFNSWMGGNWNKSVKNEAHSFKYGFGLNLAYSRYKGFTDGDLYDSKSLRVAPRVTFTYDYGELLSVNPSYNLVLSQTRYTDFVIDEASTVQHRFNLQLTSYWPKHVIFGNDFGYTYNSNIAAGFKKDFLLWNSSLGYNFLGDKLLAKVKVYDLLNQNQSTMRTITATYIRDEQNVVLTRYVMFSLTYKLDKFAGSKKK